MATMTIDGSTSIPKKKRWYTSLYAQVIIAIVSGILLGHFAPDIGSQLKPLGDGFIKLIKMIIGPVIFCTIVHGIAGMDNIRAVGRVGVKALIYFLLMTILALIIGLVVANLYGPGVGMNIDPATLDTKSVETFTAGAHKQEGLAGFLLGIIPTTLVSAFSEGNILQILFISILFAIVLARAGEKGRPIVHAIERFSVILFGLVNMIMKAAPIGAFGAMSFTIGKYGIASLSNLMELMLCFYVTCALFIFVVLWAVMRFIGLPLLGFLKYIREEIFIVIGTSSSESVLPRMIEKLTGMGVQRSVAGMVIPTGYSFNLDGTAIYLTMAAIFIAQATNTPVTLAEEISLLAIMLITSKGAAGVTGSGFIVLAATLATVGHIPVAGIALILGIDRFMSEARALTNLIGNGVATLFVAKWENSLDMAQARAVLSGEKPAEEIQL